MYCNHCGAALPDQAAFCSACGTRLGTEPLAVHADLPPSRRDAFLGKRPVVIVVAVLLMMFLYWLGTHDETHQGTSPQSVESAPVAPQSVESAPVIHAVGQSFTVGYWTYVVNGVDSQPWLPDFGRMKLCDSGNCVVVNLTVRNDDTTSSTRPIVNLVDSAGREFSETDTWTDTQLSQLQQLNPGVSKRGYIYFDAPRGNYQLKVSGGYTSGVNALVDLTSSRPAEAQASPVEAYVPPVQSTAETPRYAQPVQETQPSQDAVPAQSPSPPTATEVPSVSSDAVPSYSGKPSRAPSALAEDARSDVLMVTVTETKVVKHIDPQGHAMLLAKAYRKDAPDDRFSLICHTARSSCSSLREGEDYNARILQPGDPSYDYDYAELKGAVIVRIDNAVFALMRKKKVPER